MIELKGKEISSFLITKGDLKNKSLYGYIVNKRVLTNEIPTGYKKYEIQGSDYNFSKYARIKKEVLVNFCATLLTKADIEFNKYGYTTIISKSIGSIIP